MVASIRTEEDRQVSKEDRMRNHFGMNKQSNALKLRTATHQMSALSHDATGRAVEELDATRVQISELHGRVAAIPTSTYQNFQPECFKNYVKQLKKELKELQAQVEPMRTFNSDKDQKKTQRLRS